MGKRERSPCCDNCGAGEAHFVPPSFGDVGFYVCHDEDCALRAGGGRPEVGQQEGCTCHLSKPIPRSRP